MTRTRQLPTIAAGRALLVATLMATTGLAAAGCGEAPGVPPGGAGVDAAPPSPAPPHPWPDPDLTIVTVPRGTPSPVEEFDTSAAADIAERNGEDYERLVELFRHQEEVSVFFEQVRARYPERFSSAAIASYEGEPAWVALTGEVPLDLVPLAEALAIPVELRGGAAMTEVEQQVVLQAGLDAFTADVQPGDGWGAGLDAPTARLTVDYVPSGAKRADDATAAAVVEAMRAALGRDVAFTAEFVADDRDPTLTEPAVWFLPAGSTPDPAATSVEVLVDEQGCTSGDGAAGNTAEPVVEVTATEVRIAVSTYIRKGGQDCPGHPLAPVVVELGEPLGARTLVDAHGTLDDDIAPPSARHGDVVVPPAAPPR